MPFEFLLIPGGAFLAALAVGVVGFGDGLIVAAVWLHVLAPVEIVPLVVASGLVIHLISLISLHQSLDFSKLWPFLIAGTLGVPVGNWLLQVIDPNVFRTGVGVFLVAYGAFFLIRPNPGLITRGGRTADGMIGAIGGVLGGLAGLSGIVPGVWASLRGWSKEQQRGVFQPFVLAMHAMALGWLAFGGLVNARTGINFLWCLPAIALGSWLGLWCYGRLDEGRFRRIVLGLLLVLGVTLLI
ncbi:MAG: sulfite exporter TauE/SafE family protein [Rhodospirillales bacterium]|nr:sulfite exporter TauE/SafE family protein [Rhodospirillales bacterium]